MIKSLAFLLMFCVSTTCLACDVPAGHQQLLTVTAQGWDNLQGTLKLYERTEDNSAWNQVDEQIPVVLGQKGLAWGIGLHSGTPEKKEGDRKSPAGIFSLGTAFGFAPPSEMGHLKWEY